MTTGVADIERLAYRSWPAAEVEEVGGWMFRHTPVIDARRLNSATTPVTGSVDAARSLAAAERWFAERSIQPVVRVLSSSDPEIDRFLAASGWDLEGVTRTMAKRLDGVTPASDVRVVPSASANWADTKQRFTGMDSEMIESWLRRSEAIVGDTGFASLDRDGEIACIGLGVADLGWLGLFDLNTNPDLRRRGLARSIVDTLEAWARDKGMERAYLQVEASNVAALALYAGAGYGPLYDYWYRRRG